MDPFKFGSNGNLFMIKLYGELISSFIICFNVNKGFNSFLSFDPPKSISIPGILILFFLLFKSGKFPFISISGFFACNLIFDKLIFGPLISILSEIFIELSLSLLFGMLISSSESFVLICFI